MQKSVILGKCSIVRNFLNYIYKSIEPNLVDYYIPGYVHISQLKLRSGKFDYYYYYHDDDDDDDDNNNNNNNNMDTRNYRIGRCRI